MITVTKKLLQDQIEYLEKCNAKTDCPLITGNNNIVISNIKRLIKRTPYGNPIVYQRFGHLLVKLERDETIISGAMQSWDNRELTWIMNTDGETVGGKPSNFSDKRDFYNPIHMKEV